ncbi:bifunctional riboflavin kinase/FAD synthetase [Pelotalea chapellei]|uniref:Riboflavin biosynthesis protein n=1 Tax=Pelotalea chapellei TaxID=44671 RepID=A0ABS5U7E7_9BACT|nr:bifunctional riboflavin kinase/FAD synthetase [Pelotalea chapellei]MBT1071586.1 bifunctional riboflavin kinase/FAD synthetase [Pelotalea chapellei]
MKILHCRDLLLKNFEKSVVTIGNFDGVHRGHTEIFRFLTTRAQDLEMPSVVVTFEPHPLAVLAPELAPQRITTFDQKAALIAAAGIDCLVVIEFTPEFSLCSAESFVRDILCHSLGMRHVIIGHDYAFGRDRQGNFETLSRLGKECGFTLEDLDPVGGGGAIFSSSLARRLLSAGDITGATEVLGRYHTISGQVVHGREIGIKLGFPTANIATYNELIPPEGVYAVMVTVDDKLFWGACNIGSNPTFNGERCTVEVFLLDFSGHLYDRQLSVSFVQRLREEKKFSNMETLIEAIGHDVARTREILASVEKDMIPVPFNLLEKERS